MTMLLQRTRYVLRESLGNLRRNLLMTITALITVVISLGIVGAVLLLRQAVSNYTIQYRGGIELNIYMDEDATEAQIAAIRASLEEAKATEIKDFRYVTQQQAFDEVKILFKNDPESLELFEKPEDVPSSFRARPKPEMADRIEEIGDRFRNREGVFRVRSAEAIKTILRIFRGIQIVLLTVAVALLVAAVLLILNTIQLAIFSRRREVAVMKLVGATNWFIRLPFMVEGLLQGLFGAAVAFGGLAALTSRLQGNIRASSSSLFKQFSVSGGQVLGTGILMMVVGAAVGAIGSAIAVSRFLDV
jgi:cell division transport system permease protein